MHPEIKGAIVGALITATVSAVVSLYIFSKNQEGVEKQIVNTLSDYFGFVDSEMSYQEALRDVYNEMQEKNVQIETLTREISDLKNSSVKETEISDDVPNLKAKDTGTSLNRLNIAASDCFSKKDAVPLEDTTGNKYTSDNTFEIWAEGKEDYGYATFFMGNQYTVFSADLSVSNEDDGAGDTLLEGWVEILKKNGDDYDSIYQSPNLNRLTAPLKIDDIDVSGGEWLEIRYYSAEDYYSLAEGYHSNKIIISDGELE